MTSSESEKALIKSLLNSEIYKNYENAFAESTGLPLRFRPVECWQLPLHGSPKENGLCEMMAEKSSSCASCLRVSQDLADAAEEGPASVQCTLGLNDSAVPVRVGDRLIGYLQTGQFLTEEPTVERFERTLAAMEAFGLVVDKDRAREAFDKSRVLNTTEHDAVKNLLNIFAEHLSMLSNQIQIQAENADSPAIRKAVEYIHANLTEELSLEVVAKVANMSTFYFCKMFKKEKGINFTDYVSRARIEKAKNLLLNPNLRVSEIAYEVGFQSLTHFNRVFKKVAGCSPSQYRSKLPAHRMRK